MIRHIFVFFTEGLYLLACISVRTYIPTYLACELWIALILLDTIREDIDSLLMNQTGCEEDTENRS